MLRLFHLNLPTRGILNALGREGVCLLDREYDLFEVLEDGSLIWRNTGNGHADGIRKLQALAE